MTNKITITIEISVAELQKALLPNGGKITNLEFAGVKKPTPRTPTKKSPTKKSPTTTPKSKKKPPSKEPKS